MNARPRGIHYGDTRFTSLLYLLSLNLYILYYIIIYTLYLILIHYIIISILYILYIYLYLIFIHYIIITLLLYIYIRDIAPQGNDFIMSSLLFPFFLSCAKHSRQQFCQRRRIVDLERKEEERNITELNFFHSFLCEALQASICRRCRLCAWKKRGKKSQELNRIKFLSFDCQILINYDYLYIISRILPRRMRNDLLMSVF